MIARAPIPALLTGVGPVSAIGCGRDPYWDALVAGRHGLGPITVCDTSRSPSTIGAEIGDFDLGDYLPRGRVHARRAPRPVQFALAAASLALEDARLESGRYRPGRVGVAVGTSIGNVAAGFPARDRWARGEGRFGPDAAFHLFSQSAACAISSVFDLRGPIQTVSTGCNSGLDAVGLAFRAVQRGEVDAMLVVGTDCELVPEVLAVLGDSGSIATRYDDDPGRASRPFDADRDGNVLGEGAAGLLLEAAPHARARGIGGYARLAGYATRSAGHRRYSADAPEVDVDPSVRAFRAAMSEGFWEPTDVHLVNANGSSSVLYDRFEALALGEVFGDALPGVPVHSIKAALGQHGAGSSALQVVTAGLAIERGAIPPTINHERPDPACAALDVVTRPRPLPGPNVLVHSIGLGGFYYSCGALTRPLPLDEEDP